MKEVKTMAFNPFEQTEKERQFNPFNPEINDDDNVFEAAYHGLMGAGGNVIRTVGHMLNYEGKPSYVSDEEWAKRNSGGFTFGINKAIEDYGRELEETHQRNYSEPISANSIASGIGSVVPYAVALGLTARSGRVFDPAGISKAAGVTLGQKVAPRFGQTAARATEALVPGMVLGQRQALPEALVEAEGARSDYVENAKAQGTYKPGITEAEAERVARGTLGGNLGFITGTDAAQNALINNIALGQGDKVRRALKVAGIGGAINATQEVGQSIIPKEAAGEEWSFSDPDIIVSGIVGGLTGGFPSAVAAAAHSRFNPFNSNADTQEALQQGGVGEKEAFINAIAGQESGGDYGAVNERTGASGKYQIMPENWPAWAEEAGIGADAEMTPENQEIVARFKLGQYYDKYGARDAAIAWYGGEGAIEYSEEAKNRKQGNGNEPSINEYADSVLARMGANVGRADGSLRSYYADEADITAPAEEEVRVTPAQGYRVSEAAAEAADNANATSYDDAAAAAAYTERAARDSALTDEALEAIAANRGEWNERTQTELQNVTPSRFAISGRGSTAGFRPRSWRNLRRSSGSGIAGNDYIRSVNQRETNSVIDRLNAENQQASANVRRELPDGAKRRITNRVADNLAEENRRAEDSLKMNYGQFKGQSTPQFRTLLQRIKAQREQAIADDVLRNKNLESLTNRAMSGDRSARHTFDNLRPDVQRFLLGRHITRLEAQNDAAEADVAYKALRIAEQKQAVRDAAQREANRRDMLQSAEEYFRSDAFDSPLEGVRSEIKDTQESVKNMLRPIVDTILSGGGNRPMLVDTEESYRKIRVSQNAPFYSDLYKKYGRRPALRELYDEARDIYTGDSSIAIPGWQRNAENEADFAHNKAVLKELDDNLDMYEELEKKFAAEPNGGRRNGENTQRKEHNNQDAEPQESQQGRETGEESKNAEAEKEVTESKEPATKAEKKETKPAKRPKAEAKFTDKSEKLVPQTAELRGNEITVISKPNAKARDSERYIGRELPEGEYTVTVDEWKKAGRFGNPNAAWHRLVKGKYANAFPNTGVKAEGMTSGAEPVHDRIIDSQITAIKQAVKAYDEIHATPAATATEQQPAADNKRFDGERATSALDKLIGRKQPAQQEQQTGKKFMNVFDESELDAEIAKAKAEMSKLSANPFFNPALMKSLFKIGGIYMQRGVNNFADWSARMVETLGNKVRPFLKSAWDALQAYPADVKFNDDIMTATLEFVGSRAENGRTREQIRNEFSEMYGDEYVAYVDAAYEGVQSYPTEIEENSNVIQEDVQQEAENETQETTAEETENPAQSKTAQEVTRQETQPTEQQGYGRNKDIYIEYNPKTRRLYVDVSKAKNKFREEEVHLIPAGFKWSTARQKWYGVVSDNPNEYDSIRNYAKSIGFEFENTASTTQDSAQQTESTTQEQTPATEEKTPQNAKSVDSGATFNINDELNGIEIKFSSKPSEEVRRGLKDARYRWSSAKQLWYAKQTPAAMAFAESIGYVPENVVQSNQANNATTEQKPTQEVEANGHDDNAQGLRGIPENVSEREVPRTEGERETERVREGNVDERGSEVTGHSGRATGERPVPGERGLTGESAAQSSTGSDSEGTSERGSVRALKPSQKKNAKASEVPGHNFTITDDENIGKGGAKTKYKDNVAAIRLLKQLEAENRLATPEEQKVLARYVGWGGLSPVFSYGRDPAWESEKAEIKELLTDEEYSAARESTLNAHYTSPEVIKGVWKILERLGFKGGKVLEPSMGIGNFFGIMPEKLRSKSSLNGVELDPLTGRIAKQLYQKANVEVTGYEQTKFPDNYFDLVISNVPFGDYKLHDPKYNKYNFNIHNYFFAKAVDQVRPGGIVAFITSTGTMQSGSDSKRLREILKNKADFIGAVRLPDTAFKENAGTEVTTDLIILQKREPGAAPGKNNHAWLDTADTELRAKYGGYPLQINEYYRDNPDMLIGELKEDTLYSGGRLALDGRGLDVGKELENRVEKFPKNIYKTRTSERNINSLESARKFLAPSEVRKGQFVVMKDGVYFNDNGEMTPLPKAAQARAKDYVQLRDTTKKILDGQINPKITDEALNDWRKDLNKLYDKFVAKYGYLNNAKNKRDLANDPDFGIVAAIEKYTLDKKTKKESAEKADIFTKRTVNPIIKIDKADNPSDALALSLSNTGAVDVDYMAQLTGQKADDIVKSLKGYIYKDPATDSYVTADDYLSGNVREKLEIAELAAKTDSSMRENVEALKKVQPADLRPDEISVGLGTPWIPESDIRAFAREMMNMGSSQTPLDIRFNRAAGTWLVSWNKDWSSHEAKNSTLANQKWGTRRRDFGTLLDDALNQRSPIVRDTDIDGNTTVNADETQAAQTKLKEIKNEFSKWIWKDKDRADRLAAYYNRNYNNMRLREYNGSMLTLPGYSSVAPPLKQHQKDAVWRIIQDGTALLAHTVGAGKTWTMQTAAMELKRLGIVNKSMFVIPNHMLQQFENEFRIIYPNAKLLTISSENLPDVPAPSKKGETAEAKKRRAAKIAERQKILSRIATEDWDGIIISHNMFKRIPMSPEAYNAFYQDQIDTMRNAIIELSADDDRNSKRLVKELEKKAKSLEEKLKRDMNEENKDIVIPFEQLGIDEIFVDEADLFKNLFFVTKMNRIGGLSNTNSQRSLDMYMKTQYLAKHNNGRGVVFATGTPISNTMAEMFTMLRYLDGAGLKEKDMDFFDNWAAQFAERETVFERSPDGQGYRRVEKFTKFKNMPELVKMFRKVADVKTKDDLDLKIPKLKNNKPTVIEVEPNSALEDYIKRVARERAQDIHERRVDPSVDNMLKLTGDLRKASLDMRLIDPSIPASIAGNKLKAVAENVYKKYIETNDTKGAQLVFCDLSTPKGTSDKVNESDTADTTETAEEGENVTAYAEIKKMLVKQGVPSNEVAFIHDAKTKEQKEELFAKVRDGRVRVLIGSTEKMGAGTNVQKKLVALHHVDAPWRPRDIEQREGRILRQGNENAEVEIFNYVTKDSFDANMWEKLKNKATMIAQALSNNLTGRTLEDADATVLNFAEIESLASGNPLIMEKVSVEADVNNYTSLYGSYLRNRAENESKASTLPRAIEYNKTIAENARKDIKNRTSIEGDKFSITLGKKVFTKRADAKEVLDAYASNKSSNTTRSIGKIGGFELRLRPLKAGEKYPQNGNMFEVKEDGVVAELIGANTYNCDATLGSIEYAVMHAPDKTLERALRSVENSEKELKAIEAEIAEPFKYEKEFEAAKKRLAEINAELGIDENGVPQYSATTETTETRSYDEAIAELKNALPTAKFEVAGGEIVAEMPNKARFKVNVADKVIVNDREAAAARSEHGLDGDVNIEGMWQRIKESDVDGALTVSRTGRKGTAYHEVMHAAMDLALTGKERAALIKHFAKKAKETGKSLDEAIADGYAEWVQARKRGSGTMFGKLFNKMRDMYYQLKAVFTGIENAENVMRRVESGEAWTQRSDRGSGNATRYSANENKNLTSEEKVANAITNTERKTAFQSAKDWIAQQKKEFYKGWLDKNNNLQDLVAGLEMTLGRKLTNAENIYRRVRILPSTTAGMANALIEGGKEELKAINSRLKVKLKYPVTMQMVLDNINRKKMDAAHPDYLKKSGFKSWIEAFGAYLTSIRLNEMMLLHDEAYKEKVKEWEANGKKGRKPAYKPYLLPKGITQTDLETVIKNAPPEFRKAANMYYQFNDNVLTILEDAGLIDAETHRILNTKYKYYCPLMRDFSDTASADSFIGGLTNGGRGIANVSNMLKRISIEGSERKVLNPLESTIKAVAVACNRAERNKVGQLAVQLAAKGGMDGVIQPVEGTTVDAKNCIFTVMFDGKKQAYKTIPELYDPIVGYNLPAADFMFGIARNAARLLRAGATSSPSFIIRNLIRDTIFAGISSKNGFIPFVDTVRGMYALARDPRLKAEFKVAGVTAFKQYSSTETAVKGLDRMAGGKAKRDYDIGDWWNAFIGTFQNWSEFAEAGTRMGEFMKARANGKSIEEAAFDAREVTLDFSRSGVYGERINRYVPFFNAVLQGGDKMIRLFKEDPMGTSLKLAAYIILPSLALWAYNHDEDWYKELDPEIKATCWCLPGGFFRIPKPQEAGILFGSGIEAMLDQAFNNDPEAIKNWAEVFRENITPSIFPTLFLPIWEWNSNYSNFRDAPITPQRLQNLPDELQYTPSTSALARTLGGELKLSPLKIDNTFRGYTGTMGMALVHMFDWFADSKQNMPAKTIKEMPVIRDFTVNQNIQNRSVDDFYTMLHKANEQHAGYGVKGKPSPTVKGVRAAGKLISEAQKDIRELTVNPRLSPEVKRQRIDQKKTYIKNIAKKANARFGRFFEE